MLAAHVVVSGRWLGIAFAKLVLGLAAATSDAPAVCRSLYPLMEAANVGLPPAARLYSASAHRAGCRCP
jgi:hypothetical protein